MSRSAVVIPQGYRSATKRVLDGSRAHANSGGMSLKNSRVLVIGGTSGIGLGVASAAAERGAVPIVVSRRQSSVARALGQLPDGAHGAPVDLADPASLDQLAADLGQVDHLAYTA